MSNSFYTREDVVALLKQRQGSKTSSDFAEEIGISVQLLSSVLNGTRNPAGEVLKYLRLKKRVVYGKS